MKTLARLLFCIGLLGALDAQAQPRREFNQAELDALLAPVALYPDALLAQILTASTYPDQVAEAARGWRSTGFHPSVTALMEFPDVLARMAENPQWLRDLGEAYQNFEPYVMETVQQLRRRAEAAGNLRSDERQQVYRQGEIIVVRPVVQQVVYAPYYNPLVVFGTWWWASFRPVVWRPWHARPVHINVHHWQQHRPPHRPPHRAAHRPVQTHVAPIHVPIRSVSHPVPRLHAAPVIVRPQITVRPQVQHVVRPAAIVRHAPIMRHAPAAPRPAVQHARPKQR